MSNYIDIQKIQKPQAVDTKDYLTTFNELKQDLLIIAGKDAPNLAPVLELESEPLTLLLQLLASEKMRMALRVNNAIIATFLPYALGVNLDNLAKNYNLTRHENESDEELRRRCFLSREGLNGHTAGDYYLSYFLNKFNSILKDVKIKAAEFSLDKNKVLVMNAKQYKGNLEQKETILPGYIFAYYLPQLKFNTSTLTFKKGGEIFKDFQPSFDALLKNAQDAEANNIDLMLKQISTDKIEAPNDRIRILRALAIIPYRVIIRYTQYPNTPQNFLEEVYIALNKWAGEVSFKLGRNATKSELIAIMRKFSAIQNVQIDLGNSYRETGEQISLAQTGTDALEDGYEVEDWEYLVFWQAKKPTEPPPWLNMQFVEYKE